MKRLRSVFQFFLLIGGLYFLPVVSVFADSENDTDKKELDISLSPKDTLFDISNMKPGDWAPRTLTVKNSGSKDFNYYMHLQNNGEKKLYNELLLEIKSDDKELYQGKLAAFKSLPARKLTNRSDENLDITIRFPEHLGNEFQGLDAVFDFIFSVERKNSTAIQAVTKGQIESGGVASAGLKLPATSTNLFNLMLVGSVLVLGGIVLMIIRHYKRTKIAQ
ncbi:TasA family protein [Sporosarcina sp. SAFN-010]|uniref:TasA family protein n=1 Tax=Sporosarcina sp. SAFN-010 TaxID=3387273 RepID=UPI003F7E5510